MANVRINNKLLKKQKRRDKIERRTGQDKEKVKQKKK